MVKVYTGRLWVADKDKLDITVKSGDLTFAPTWDLVTKYKRGQYSEEEYIKHYYNLMRNSYKMNRGRWEEVLNMERVVFTCFCPSNGFCHRYLLKDIFIKLGATYGGEIDM